MAQTSVALVMGEHMWTVQMKPLRSTYGVDRARMFEVMARRARRAFKRSGLKSWKPAPLYPPLIGAESVIVDDIRLVVQYNVVRDEYERRADVLV